MIFTLLYTIIEMCDQTPDEMIAQISEQLTDCLVRVHRLEQLNIEEVIANKCKPNGNVVNARKNRFLMEDIDIARRDIKMLMDLLDSKIALRDSQCDAKE